MQKEHAAKLPAPAHPVDSNSNWERFHKAHSSAKFFKERRYLPLAFPDLVDGQPKLHIVELGAGAGAAVMPILRV